MYNLCVDNGPELEQIGKLWVTTQRSHCSTAKSPTFGKTAAGTGHATFNHPHFK